VKPKSFSERFQHRRSSYKELQYISDGDSNGVIYYAGTSFGKHQWMNPVLTKNITGGKQPELQAHGSEGFGFKELPGMMIALGIMADKRSTFFWWWSNIKNDMHVSTL